MKRFIAILFSCLAFLTGIGDVLQWQINENASVDNSSLTVYNFLEPDREIGAQAVIYDSQGNFIKGLPLVDDPDYSDSFVGSKEDLWMMRALQSIADSDIAMDYLFQLQVGYYDDDFNFIAHLYSVSEYYKDLYGVHTYEEGTILPPINDWVPENFYTINPVIPSPPLFQNPPLPFSVCLVPYYSC